MIFALVYIAAVLVGLVAISISARLLFERDVLKDEWDTFIGREGED